MLCFKDYLIEAAVRQKKPKKRPNKNLWFNIPEYWVDDLQFDKGDVIYHEDEEENIYATDPEGIICFGYWDKKKNGGMTFAKGRPFLHYSHMKKIKQVK